MEGYLHTFCLAAAYKVQLVQGSDESWAFIRWAGILFELLNCSGDSEFTYWSWYGDSEFTYWSWYSDPYDTIVKLGKE